MVAENNNDHEDLVADTDADEDDGNQDDANDDDDEEEEEDMFDPAEIEQICTAAMTLIQNRSNLPSRFRDRTMVRVAQQFIHSVKDDIHKNDYRYAYGGRGL